jgi:hypothetical protein
MSINGRDESTLEEPGVETFHVRVHRIPKNSKGQAQPKSYGFASKDYPIISKSKR